MKVTRLILQQTAVAVVLTLVAFAAPLSGDVRPDHGALRVDLDALRARRPRPVPQGTIDSIAHMLDIADQVSGSFPAQAAEMRHRAAAFMHEAQRGYDPMPRQRGLITLRGYRSRITENRQGYSIYLPPDYDASKRYPLMVVLHGGSANGHLFLGVVLGNNMNWKEYDKHLWDELEPRWKPDWIVVAPDGFGQVMWRWMGEQDVLDVIDDVQQHYSVDADRVVLGGLSNGGVGAYNIGMRHAWRFAAVMALAGAPSWLQYAGGRMSAVEEQVLRPLSGMELIENAHNTDFRYYHGRRDGGPMKPRFVEELTARITSLNVPHRETWYDAGHDLLYLVHRHGKIYDELANVRREPRPAHVVVVTGDYRANRQHWITVTGISDLPNLARVEARVNESTVTIATRGADALSIDLRDVPLANTEAITIRVDEHTAYEGPRADLGHVAHFVKRDGTWRPGFVETTNALRKEPGLSGPIGDAYVDGMVHVYGTGKPNETEALKRVAEQGARGWPLWLWRHQQRVIADTQVTEELLRSHHVVLYGTPGSNSVLDSIAAQLPIRVGAQDIAVGDRTLSGTGVGTRFVYPNPRAPQRYVIVQAAPTLAGVQAGNRLPDFLADYVVFDAKSTQSRPRLVFDSRRKPLAEGFFDGAWKLPGVTTSANETGGSDADGVVAAGDEMRVANPEVPWSSLPVPPAPPLPARVKRFAVPMSDPAGESARTIARRVGSFENFRATIAGGTWRVEQGAVWQVQREAKCLSELTKAGVRYEAWQQAQDAQQPPDAQTPQALREPLPTPVPTPVILRRIDGVVFHSAHDDREVVVSCELARRLVTLAAMVKKHGITAIDVMSSYREQPRVSFHSFGLALDILRFRSPTQSYTVLADFERTPDHETCSAPQPNAPKAKVLLAIACDLASSNVFASVLTPNYNEGHRDHFHVDVRPDDPRIFVR